MGCLVVSSHSPVVLHGSNIYLLFSQGHFGHSRGYFRLSQRWVGTSWDLAVQAACLLSWYIWKSSLISEKFPLSQPTRECLASHSCR